MQDHTRYLNSNAGSFIARGVFDRGAVDFYRDLFGYHYKWFDEFRRFLHGSTITMADVPPLLRAGLMLPDKELKAKLIHSLGDLAIEISKSHPGMDFKNLIQHLSETPSDIDELIADLLSGDRKIYDRYNEKFNTGIEETIFIIINWMKPFFSALSDRFTGDIDQEEWYESSCPFCGYYPDIAKIEESKGGKRTLHCALCEYEWIFKRIACTVCGNTNTETLGFFEEEDSSPYRIEYCDECRAYIKSVKYGKFDETDKFDLSVENVLTAYLDYSAIQKGYHRP